MSDAIAIARHILWADREQAHFDEHGESYDPSNPKPAFDEPEPTRPDDKYSDENAAFSALAACVLAQNEELAKLWTCPRCGRSDLTIAGVSVHTASCMSRTDDEQRIDELRAALTEALDEWRHWLIRRKIDDNDPAFNRISELRKLT